jgi:hypothetical protein
MNLKELGDFLAGELPTEVNTELFRAIDAARERFGEEAGDATFVVNLWFDILCRLDMEAAAFSLARCREQYEEAIKRMN